MKELFKKIFPHFLISAARKARRLLFREPLKNKFTSKQLHDLDALKCLVSYNKYGGYCVPESSRHRPAAQKILAHEIYEPLTIEYMVSSCGNGDIIHAGTYFGDFLPALSKGVADGSKVWAFEPNPENFRCARITLEINNINNIELINAGIGSSAGEMLVQVSDDSGRSLGGASRLINENSDSKKWAETVRIVALDDIIGSDRNISILQLDVEGHEKHALEGALGIIGRCRPIIILEVLPDSTLLESHWFSLNILELGYKKTIELHGNAVFCI